LGCAGYTLQLYFDFAGYSAMAIGIGLMLGFHFPENFNHPYLASSIQDFWRRWHISLSSWLRDYLYIALGGNRVSHINTYRNLILVMAIGGLWHGGDSWNYLFWGLAHGTALAVARFWGERGWSISPWMGRLLTLLFVMCAWTLFRSTTLHQAAGMLAGQLGLNGGGIGDAMSLALRPSVWAAYAAGLICTFLPLMANGSKWSGMGPAAAWTVRSWPVATFLLSLMLIASRGAAPFLYFQF
jgi:alginate O-acetyltransferase complex protein AlgI